MDQKTKNQIALNRLVVVFFIIVTLSLATGNIVGVLRGEKSKVLGLLSAILGVTTNGLNIVHYLKSPDSTKVKYYGCIGFLIMYTFAMLTTNRNIVFILIIPIMYIYTMYNNIKLMRYLAVAFTCISFISIVNFVFVLKLVEGDAFMNYSIQVIATLAVAVTSAMICRLNVQFHQDNMNQLLDANEKQQIILNEVLEIGSILDCKSKEINAIVNDLKGTSDTMTMVMATMLEGVSNTIVSIDNQNNLTSNIQNSIEETTNKAQQMDAVSNQSLAKLQEGVVIMDELSKNTVSMRVNGEEVASSMAALKEKTTEINHITDVITAIAKKINILSLNASIESARAGEAGKSFAVVAKEIGELASQTTYSVTTISNIVIQLQSMVTTVFHSLEQFMYVNEEQNGLIGSTEKIFENMTDHIEQVNKMVEEVTMKVTMILDANLDVKQNIEELVAESSESRHHIQATTVATQNNIEKVEQAKAIADELLNASVRLHKYV